MTEDNFIKYDTFNSEEQVSYLIKPIIKALKDAGGSLDRTALKSRIRENDKVIDEFADKLYVSSRSGNDYSKFEFKFNFAIKELSYVGILNCENKKKTIVLTDKGQNISLDNFDVSQEVRVKARAYWDSKAQKNKEKKEKKSESILKASRILYDRETFKVNEDYFPKDYNPGISSDTWLNLLNDKDIFNTKSLQVMKRMLALEGQATCTELAETFGEDYHFYISVCSNLARRVSQATNCPLYPSNGQKTQWWTILFIGTDSYDEQAGSFTWCLREELHAALDKFDLSNINLYSKQAIWKIEMDHNRLDQAEIQKYLSENKIVLHKFSGVNPKNRTYQGEYFINSIKKDDFFFLCSKGKVLLFGQFAADDAKTNDKGGDWYEREFTLINKSLIQEPILDLDTKWYPAENSSCIEVEDLVQFEDKILKPCFCIKLDEIINNYGNKTVDDTQDIDDSDDLDIEDETDSEIDTEEKHYWWLNARPSYWIFQDKALNEELYFTMYNENGEKRHIFKYFLEAKPGDEIICYEASPTKKIVALGEITRENDGKNIYFSLKEHLTNKITLKTLQDTPKLSSKSFGQNGSLFKLTKDEFDCIMDLIRDQNPEDTSAQEEVYPIYTKEDFLNEVFMSSEQYEHLKNLLQRKKNIILQGAPGVGKTFCAKRLAYSMMNEKNESRVKVIQFHQSYSYEDFIMGYRPSGNGFELKYGVFYDFCKKAENQPDQDFFFIIDEINRGNLSKIFGELMQLIEVDYRGQPISLTYENKPFAVPKNLYIIGMMNTADRSLAMIDYALRRRFSFFNIEPGFNSEGFTNYQNLLGNQVFDNLIKKIELLNDAISKDSSLSDGFKIGHSYFCGLTSETVDNNVLRSIVEYDIMPMLKEYWFDEEEKYNTWSNDLLEVFKE